MKKLCVILIAAYLLSTLCMPVFAEETALTEAEVEFKAGTGPTKPVHPDDPNIDSNEDPVEGSLAIVSVSDFNFGIIPISIYTTLTSLEPEQPDPEKPNLQVVDLRGAGTGWNVSALLSRFSDSEGDSLPGAEILIKKIRTNSLSTSAAPKLEENVRLFADGKTPASVITATEGAGTGLWVMRWYPASGENTFVQLRIPAGIGTLGSHKATINWVLSDGP